MSLLGSLRPSSLITADQLQAILADHHARASQGTSSHASRLHDAFNKLNHISQKVDKLEGEVYGSNYGRVGAGSGGRGGRRASGAGIDVGDQWRANGKESNREDPDRWIDDQSKHVSFQESPAMDVGKAAELVLPELMRKVEAECKRAVEKATKDALDQITQARDRNTIQLQVSTHRPHKGCSA